MTAHTTWLRGGDEPRWGHPDGIQIGLHPLSGPRGLLRVYAPYLDHPRDRLINFIAVEPIPVGATERGYSELEHSALDDVQGKRMWAIEPHGETTRVDGVERLHVDVGVERFDNGADVRVRVGFRADRPHELSVAAFRNAGSLDLEACVLSATMGNFARLRMLHVRDGVVTPAELWPDLAGAGFSDHARFGLDRLPRDEAGGVVVSATPDETDPWSAEYAASTAEHWKYLGKRATQTWRASDPDPRIEARVNGRRAYWASESPIPGGTAYENFELVEPFRDGRTFVFGVEPIVES